ncbi:IS110 family transposase [Pseudactinotalea sp. HY158]|uniref:IS110 family transposase n=1 Tax=Pseudactinotalea sp. HY158 TaxID=2654547 RepID=UPI00129D0FE8|nr:IS110 family transposase [Pseudactinotalea sp. HY158]QGH70622.1 IS110 family transposase [Pseudactinotalea sp. HY158]
MKSANTPTHEQTLCLPEEPPGDVTAGLDWARDDHAVSVVDHRGREIDRCMIEHTAEGLRALLTFLARNNATEVAIERPDGPVIDTLLDAGITVVVISPNQVKNIRRRYGSSGNKDDRFDAFVLADTLRTDRARLRPLVPDRDDTIALRRACRARKDLIAHRIATGNQLRAHLRNALPATIGLFKDIDSDIALSFLERFDTQDKLDWLTPTRLGTWLANRDTPDAPATVLHTKILAAPRGPEGDFATALATITASHVAVLRTLQAQTRTLEKHIDQQLTTHPDAHIFTSLPRSGRVRAARLLAEIGDCRSRFPTPEALICLAGAAPSTRQSGRIRVVGFRWSCDKQLRDAVTDFAADSIKANPWAAHLYQQARTRGHDHPHAVRILARAWLTIIWHCWQDHVPYNPSKHRALQPYLTPENKAA